MKKNFKLIGFDADDTLWINEPLFQATEQQFCALLADYLPAQKISEELLNTERANIEPYGYGVKAFVLSMIETALRVSNHAIEPNVIEQIIQLGKALLNQPVVLFDGVPEVLEYLRNAGYQLVVATKGDLLDQERKLAKSGIANSFHHIEIMSDKADANYAKLLSRLEIPPPNFLMIGNSLKSDCIPVLKLGGTAVHIPYHTTWAHEQGDPAPDHPNFYRLNHIDELIKELPL